MNGLTNHVLMVRPYFFKKNEQTAVNNYFQKNSSLNDQEINDLAKKEFVSFQKGDIQNTQANVNKLIKEIKFKPSTSIEKGVKNFCDWFLSYYKK